jgi:hypothetical protein
MLQDLTPDLVWKICKEFDDENELVEVSLTKLIAHFRKNTDPSEVYLKIVAINQIYSTRINTIDLDQFARHIADLDIDKLIDNGSLEAVEKIIDCPPLKRHYSFATKFCSWHNQTAYPIYDWNANTCLWAYQRQDQFGRFHRQDLWEYGKFVEVVKVFRNNYNLAEFDFKQLDKVLWKIGGRINKIAT